MKSKQADKKLTGTSDFAKQNRLFDNLFGQSPFHFSRLTPYFSVIIIYSLLYTLPAYSGVFSNKPKTYTPESNYKYQWKVLRADEKEKYERSLLPESGYMTREEYEKATEEIPNKDRTIPEYKLPKDIKMQYVPQPTYKLVRYNNPPGSPELKLGRKFKYDRQFICPGITSPQKDVLVYTTVSYYATNQCTTSDLYEIPLDKTLSQTNRVLRANIIKRKPEPILSTSKDTSEKFTFRTLTPIDFSKNGQKLLVKEKIGNENDGIWQTNIWVYDFQKRTSKEIPEIREAVNFYWRTTEGIELDEKRWDISPLGFLANDENRLALAAYGWTGGKPKFLGVWSIDTNGEQTRLESLFKIDSKISENGYKLIQDGIVDPAEVYYDEKAADKAIKKKRKAEKKAKKAELKKKKDAYNAKIKEMKTEEKEGLKQYHKFQNSSYSTGNE